MRALICAAIAVGLALAVSAQRQPAAKAQDIKPLDVPFPALEPGQKPNFIVIVTDDQGWDDIGRNNPKFVSTPNLDRFFQEGTFFDNYYVTPQCAQSRAAMLTGRYPARVGTMLVNGAWDFISSYEVTGAKLLGSQNYSTAQFGKWHNSEVQGYEPWSPMVGFQRANIPVSNDGTNNMRLMRTNGSYEAAQGDIERVLLAKLLRYLNQRDDGSRPFYVYYAPHSIHLLYEKVNGKRQTNQIRFSPAPYKEKYHRNPRLQALGVTNSTIDAWAALEYLDDVLGSLFDYLKETGLDKTTYVMVMSDNGSAMLRDERPSASQRMPSGMKGDKSTIWEGGIRNFLAVQGPGVQAGVVDSTLLHIIDVLPTISDLAGVPKGAAGHLPFDGLSFKNLLLAGIGEPAPAARKRKAAVPEAGNALGEDVATYPAGYKPPVAAMAAPAAKAAAVPAPVPSTRAAAVTGMSMAPVAAAPDAKAPAAGAAKATPAASSKAPVTKAPAAPAAGSAAASKAPVAAAPVTKAPAGNQTASNAPVAAAPVIETPTAATTGNTSGVVPAPVAEAPTPATTPEPATAVPVPTPTPAADSTGPVTATSTTAAPVTQAPADAPEPTPAANSTTAAPVTGVPAAAPAAAPATKEPAPAPATKAAAPAAPAAGSKTPAPAKKNSIQAAVPPATGKTPAPLTGKAVKPPSAGKPPAASKPATGKTSKTRAAAGNKDDATEEPAVTTPAARRIVGGGGRSPVSAWGNSLASWQQNNRMLFFMGPHCWDANAVPILGPNREVLRPQPLFNFKTGGMLNVINGRELPPEKKKTHPGFEVCMAVRHREFKWMGLTDKVYRVNGTHKEERSTEVPEPQATALRTIMRGAAEKWWQSVVMEPHSLEKPMFYLGLEEGVVSNMLVSGAHERTAENIRLIPNGAAGFKVAGDRICFTVKVMSPGTYDVTVFYASAAAATMKLSIGTYGAIQTGAAKSITATLPAQGRMRGLNMGAMVNLTATGAKPTEACLQLVSSTAPGKAIFSNLANIRFTKRQPWQNPLSAPRKPNQPVSHHGFGALIDSVPTSTASQGSGSAAAPMAVPAPGLDMANPSNSWLRDVAAPAAGFGDIQDKWEALRMRNAWPDGQGAVFESMYSPYHTEDIAECSICKPEV